MRKLFFTFLVLVMFTGMGNSQVTTLWEKSAATSSLTSWFDSGSLTRGLAYGNVGGNDRLYIVSRSNGNMLYIYNATNGDSVGVLDPSGITGGTYAISDAGVSTDGVIFVCNLTVNASTSAFKVYKYTTEAAAAVEAINYTATAAARLGDKITVTGSTADNSIVIWAASANTKEVYKFTTADNGATFTPSIVPLPSLGSVALGSASVGPLSNGDFYYNTGGQSVQKFLSDGALVDTVSGSIVSTGSNAIRFMGPIGTDEYFATYAYGTGNENARIVKVPGGDINNASLLGTTNSLGSVSNTGGTGDLAVQKVSTYIYNVYVLGTNNGFGAYQLDLRTQLSGDYYVGAAGTGPSGSDPDFASLNDAFDVINNANITGNCTFYITSDITEPCATNGIGLAVNPEPYTITIKPYTGVQPVVTLQYIGDVNSGPSGAFVIGIPQENKIAWNDLRKTKNIVIDGSNTVDGTTRDLTITTETTSARNAFPVTVVGDVSYLTIKNCNIFYKSAPAPSTSNLFIAAVQLRARVQNSADWVPSNITLENNHISANFAGNVRGAQGVVTVLLGTATAKLVDSLVIKNNVIEGKQRAVALGYSANTEVYGNDLIVNQDIDATVSSQAFEAAQVDAGATTNIYNNNISSISSIASGSGVATDGIKIESAGIYNVYNNMIYGFNLAATNPTSGVSGIVSGSSTATVNISYNSILMNNLADIGTGTVTYSGIQISNGTNSVLNNIVSCEEPDFATYCIYRDGTAGSLASDFNDFYTSSATNGNIGFWDVSATALLADWQTASGQDAMSVSKQVFFTSATDLHLAGASIGDLALAGTPVAGITTDIDGDVRNLVTPYKGADESSVQLPVELTSFLAEVVSGSVHLTWGTATEINNKGFEVERSNGSQFVKVDFVQGRGTSTKPSTYNFVDKNLADGKYSYRLKQIDFDGTYSYSNVINVEVVTPKQFNLSQNYPNPFNPTTTINYEVAVPVNVTLKIYNMLGEEVATLINNQFREAGQYNVNFNASKLASGAYVYRLTAGNFVQTKKMILTK